MKTSSGSEFVTTAEPVATPNMRHNVAGLHRVTVEMPGHIINVDDDNNLVTIEVASGNQPILNTSEFERLTHRLSLEDRNRLYIDLTEKAIVAIVRATLTIKV